MSRLILPSLFPQYDRIIFCDVDVLFVGDVSKGYFLLNPDDPYYFAAVKEYWFDKIEELIKHRRAGYLGTGVDISKYFLSNEENRALYENYFNVGFVVVNLQAWRKDGIEAKCLEFLAHKNYALIYFEQETLTLVCQGHILELPHGYNEPLNNPTSGLQTEIIMYPSGLQTEIIMYHFVGDDKPWKPGSSVGVGMWMDALSRTPLCAVYTANYHHFCKFSSGGKNHLLERMFSKRDLLNYVLFKIKKKIKGLVLRHKVPKG